MSANELLGRVVIFDGHDGLIDPEDLRRELAPVALEMAGKVREGMPAAGALGQACRDVRDPGHRWMSHGRKDGASRWVRCDVHKTEQALEVEGHVGANVDHTGKLGIDDEVPQEIADQIAKRYGELRGGVTSRMLGSMVERELRVRRKAILGTRSGGVYLVGEEDATGLEDIAGVLGRFGATLSVLPWVDPARWRRKVEDAVVGDVETAIKKATAAIEKAKSGKAVQERSAESARLEMLRLEERIDAWSTRMQIDLGQTQQTLAHLREAIADSYREAIARREAESGGAS